MKTYHCYASVIGSKYLGTVEADNEEHALDLAWKLETTGIHVCHQCADHIENPEVDNITVEEELWS